MPDDSKCSQSESHITLKLTIMTKTPGWTKVLGALSTLPFLNFWFLLLSAGIWDKNYPGKPGSILAAVLFAIPLSLAAAIRGSRIWFVTTAMSSATILFVGFRLH
jgi:hypothetical protein